MSNAQAPIGPTTDANRRTHSAVRVEKAPQIDGLLDDLCWQQALVAADFITLSPSFGQPSSERTEVRVLYTDEAVYIGAYLYMRDAARLRSDLTARDASSNADQFHVGLDTYRDRQNAFRFEVTAAGVQRDGRMSSNDFDLSWDAVWDARTRVHTDGWSVEMRIPFSALRFAKQPEQVWGMQFARQLQYANEFSAWSPVDPNGAGAMPQWGDLSGLRDLNPPMRLAFSPYLAAGMRHAPVSTDPVEYANSRTFNGGMDVKWGLNESFTLDATLVPNFGEALSDNIVRNLSPFEVAYEERRQFFTEGTELFGKGEMFYSRRIGDRPPGFFSAIFEAGENEVLLKNPSQQPLYNATKLSGRTKSKLGIGLLNAVAAPTEALIRNETTGQEREYRTAGFTNYNVLVIDQLLPNNSALAFVNTSVLREGGARDAVVSALVWKLRDKANAYEISNASRMSQVFGIDGVQRGFSVDAALEKLQGKWGWLFYTGITDDHYDQRDLGLNRRNNFWRQFGKVTFRDFQPRGNLLYRYAELSVENTLLYAPSVWEALEVFAYGETMTKNQLMLSGFIISRPLWHYDYFEPRVPGKKLRRPPFVFASAQVNTDRRKRFYCSAELQFAESPIPNDPLIGVVLRPTWVANNHLRLTGNMRAQKDYANFGAVNWDDPDRIVIGKRAVTTFDNTISVDYLFNARMNLTFRARHYWTKLFYLEYLDLNDDGTLAPSDWAGHADENFNLFNIDLVYTWQFAPGSFFNIIWKDAVFVGDDIRDDGFFQNFQKTMRAPQDNSITLKLIYWLDAGRWGQR